MNYYSDEKAAELIRLKPSLGIPDPRLARGLENCDLCGNSLFREGYSDFSPEPQAFMHPKLLKQGEAVTKAVSPSNQGVASTDVDALVKSITDQVMAAMNGATT